MTKENKFKIGLCLQGIALSLDEITLKANEDRLKMIEDIIAGEQEPCDDAISRQALLNKIYDVDGMEYFENSNIFAKHYADMVRNMPSVNPQEPKIGHWIFKNGKYRCDVCGEKAIYCYSGSLSTTKTEILSKCCPNCGADMRGGAE